MERTINIKTRVALSLFALVIIYFSFDFYRTAIVSSSGYQGKIVDYSYPFLSSDRVIFRIVNDNGDSISRYVKQRLLYGGIFNGDSVYRAPGLFKQTEVYRIVKIHNLADSYKENLNRGESGIAKLIEKHGTNANAWILSNDSNYRQIGTLTPEKRKSLLETFYAMGAKDVYVIHPWKDYLPDTSLAAMLVIVLPDDKKIRKRLTKYCKSTGKLFPEVGEMKQDEYLMLRDL